MTEKKKSALIFPAFAHEYPADPFAGFPGIKPCFNLFLKEASRQVDPKLFNFDVISNNFLGDEIETQYITFIFSCSLSDYFKKTNISPSFTAGYSMGIYSSLVHSGVISFTDGLLLIRSAFKAIRRITGDRKFGMCSVIGLSRKDIDELILDRGLEVGITNQNSQYAFVLSGTMDDILVLMEVATAEGALHTHLLKVALPYHATFLEETKETFNEFIKTIPFNHPETAIISLIDQRIMNDSEDLRNEVVNNLFTPLNWYKTQLELEKMGVKVFIECGSGDSLVKNAKFIEGDYKFYSALGYLKKQNPA